MMRIPVWAKCTPLLATLAIPGCLTIQSSGTEALKVYRGQLCADDDFWPVKGIVSRSDTPETIESANASRAGREAFCGE